MRPWRLRTIRTCRRMSMLRRIIQVLLWISIMTPWRRICRPTRGRQSLPRSFWTTTSHHQFNTSLIYATSGLEFSNSPNQKQLYQFLFLHLNTYIVISSSIADLPANHQSKRHFLKMGISGMLRNRDSINCLLKKEINYTWYLIIMVGNIKKKRKLLWRKR